MSLSREWCECECLALRLSASAAVSVLPLRVNLPGKQCHGLNSSPHDDAMFYEPLKEVK